MQTKWRGLLRFNNLRNNSCKKFTQKQKYYKMEALPNGQNGAAANGVTETDIDLEFLPLIYEIIKSIERDPTHDSTQKPRDSQDTSAKILEFEKKLNQARDQINQLPGIEHSQTEQLKQVENLRKQLLLKRQLINKYRNTCTFSIPKLMNNEQLIQRLADSYPMRRAAQLLVYFYNKNKPTALEFKEMARLEGLKLTEKLKKIAEELEKKNKSLK